MHFGSLVAALGSYLEARTRGGQWGVRIEDVDRTRVVPGAADQILHTLDAYGFEWDGAVVYQGRRDERYAEALARLDRLGRVYACTCSRKRLAEHSPRGVDGLVYPGHCRDRPPGPGPAAWRLRMPAERIGFRDGLQGDIGCDVARECGDFVLRRADGIYTYQLAVVVDDADQGITHVVRGADLLASTPRQIVLQRYLGFPLPEYLHLPVVLDERGKKLSKQTHAAPIEDRNPLPALHEALAFLLAGQTAQAGSLGEFWAMARELWPVGRKPPLRGRQL